MSTHGPIEERHRAQMNELGRLIGQFFEGYGFALFVFELNSTDGRMNYLSNSRREDMLIALKEFIARSEGMDVETPETRQ